MKAIRVHAVGGPDALRYEDTSLAEPGIGEARVKIEATGINFIDLFQWMRDGKVAVRIDKTFPLANVADAHRYLESRQVIGKLLLIP
jgi:NADPH:quinone reductase-like Zn-dependent oxidoreductase